MILVKVVALHLVSICKKFFFEYLVPFVNCWPSYDVTLEILCHFCVFFIFHASESDFDKEMIIIKYVKFNIGNILKKNYLDTLSRFGITVPFMT